jgi:putative transposase
VPEYRRAWVKGGTFFFTVATCQRRPIFKDTNAIRLLNECFRKTRGECPYTTDAIVILPDHLHCIWTLPDNDSDFSIRWKCIKTTFTKNYIGDKADNVSDSMLKKKEAGIWQRRFWEHMIRDNEDFNNHCDYIHYNPVKHGLVDSPRKWKHSSFKEFVNKGIYPKDWGQSIREEIKAMDLE